ncbi:MAG TPA: XRE family transcriptional regulator [Rhodopila sp.]|uniref:helix-turn-helix domain-containing protein n=1 Tax=Rhodopila sp. TaxID=2480087 RepID=UPI002C5EFC37|nr:XRE family transcriptional regulator [Rhodopila sp.]HVY13619.1 XRE family transcriptional regulator [Rhodopila sp.]
MDTKLAMGTRRPDSAPRADTRPSPPQEARAGDGVMSEIGQRLRAMRLRRDWTLLELSTRTGISVGMLSQIERGVSSPSIRTLQRLAESFGVPIGWFFTDAPRSPDGPSWVLRAPYRRTLTLAEKGIVKELLCPGDGKLELLLITIQPGGSTGVGTYAHAGEDAGTVLSGVLKLQVGDETALLNPGDSFRFAATLEHRFENPGDVPCVALWAVTPPLY